jgi:hypothetical protein
LEFFGLRGRHGLKFRLAFGSHALGREKAGGEIAPEGKGWRKGVSNAAGAQLQQARPRTLPEGDLEL